jgi:hypothetical protein
MFFSVLQVKNDKFIDYSTAINPRNNIITKTNSKEWIGKDKTMALSVVHWWKYKLNWK